MERSIQDECSLRIESTWCKGEDHGSSTNIRHPEVKRLPEIEPSLNMVLAATMLRTVGMLRDLLLYLMWFSLVKDPDCRPCRNIYEKMRLVQG